MENKHEEIYRRHAKEKDCNMTYKQIILVLYIYIYGITSKIQNPLTGYTEAPPLASLYRGAPL